MKRINILWACVISLCLYLTIITLRYQEKEVTVIGHCGDHEVLFSNGQSILVENAYDEAFAVGTIFIIK